MEEDLLKSTFGKRPLRGDGQILRSHPDKVSISTLRDVWRAFWNEVKSGGDIFCATNYYFDYDERTWRGTVKREMARFKGRQVEFVNIRLPNDGFVYTKVYIDDGKDQLKPTDDAVEWISGVVFELGNCAQLVEAGFSFNLVNAELKYLFVQRMVQIRFFNDNKTKCVTLNYHYGYHCGHTEHDDSGARFHTALMAYVAVASQPEKKE